MVAAPREERLSEQVERLNSDGSKALVVECGSKSPEKLLTNTSNDIVQESD